MQKSFHPLSQRLYRIYLYMLKPYFILSNKALLKNTAYVVKKFNLQTWFNKPPRSRDYFRGVLKFLKKHIPEKARLCMNIVESGCGIGQNFIDLYRIGFRNFIGIELDTNVCHAAEKFLEHSNLDAIIINDTGSNIHHHLSHNSVDVYLALNWTYFIPSIEEVFQSAHLVLKQNGLMLIDLIDRNFIPLLKVEEIAYNRYPYKHSIDEITKLCHQQSFEILKIETIYLWRFNLYLRKKSRKMDIADPKDCSAF